MLQNIKIYSNNKIYIYIYIYIYKIRHLLSGVIFWFLPNLRRLFAVFEGLEETEI